MSHENQDFLANLLAEKIAAAKRGEADAAAWLLRQFVNTVRNNRDENGNPFVTSAGNSTQFQEPLLDYLVECFEKIVKPTKAENARRITADQALNLAAGGKRGRKSNPSTQQNRLLRGLEAWKLYKLKSQCKDMPSYQERDANPNPFLVEAFKQMANSEGRSEKTISRAYTAFRKSAKEAFQSLTKYTDV